jgi:hypothetical protein
LSLSRRTLALVAVLCAIVLAGVYGYPRIARLAALRATAADPLVEDTPVATPLDTRAATATASVQTATAEFQTAVAPVLQPQMTPTPGLTPDPVAQGAAQSTQTVLYFPFVSNGPAPTPTPMPTETPGPPSAQQAPGPAAVPTRRPIRITKLGLGVYESGGGMLPVLDEARPSVILLMDPALDFAREVRQRFPKAFIVGRIYATQQPLDNPTQRGRDFADRVAASAVPLKGVVDAWMSYNEVGSHDDPARMAAYNDFQVAFASHLQDDYGIAAVAGNDGPRAVTADDYVRYFAGAIRVSRYFGFHLYPNANVQSLRDPSAASQVFSYRQIHDALQAAGIPSGKFIATEVGLYNGWNGVTSDTSMAQDFTWLADQMNNDPYVLGMTVYGLFGPDRHEWQNFNIMNSAIPQIMGDYNTVP